VSAVISHAPPDYVCPFCRNIHEGEADFPLEMLREYEHVVVKLNVKWWRKNRGAVLVVPREHYENVFDLPIELGASIQAAWPV
jgi:histidine triad (HIT) family protein